MRWLAISLRVLLLAPAAAAANPALSSSRLLDQAQLAFYCRPPQSQRLSVLGRYSSLSTGFALPRLLGMNNSQARLRPLSESEAFAFMCKRMKDSAQKENQRRLAQLSQQPYSSSSGMTAEQRLIELEQRELRSWRFFGDCAYNWAQWKLNSSTGVRTGKKACKGIFAEKGDYASIVKRILGGYGVKDIYVRCSDMRVSSISPHFPDRFWDFPVDEDRQMIIALCGSVRNP